MDDLRTLLDIINENSEDREPLAGDFIEIELGDNLLETYIEDITEDGVIIKVDETALSMLIDAKKQLVEYMKMGASTDASSSGTFVQGESEEMDEAKYQGREVSLGKPFLTPDGPKKRSVYVRKPNGKVVKVNFGDKSMRIKKSSPSHRKSFRARHRCENPGPKWKARYWSCKFW